MRPDVHSFVKRCNICQTEKVIRVKTKLPMAITDTPSKPFDKISMDFYGPLKHSSKKNHYVLTMQDWLTKFIILTPVKRATSREVAKALVEKVICYFGPPKAIVTDQGTHFQNKLLADLAEVFKIKKYSSCGYRPQSNGAIERMHHTLTEYLNKFTSETVEWDDCLPLAQHAYNATEHEATGFSPIEILTGFKSRTPTSFPPLKDFYSYDDYITDTITELTHVQTLAAMNIIQAKYRSKFYYDRKLNVKHFRPGEMVFLLKEPQIGKFGIRYKGPFEIKEVDHNLKNVILLCNGSEKRVHIDKIERADSINPLHFVENNSGAQLEEIIEG
uniref:Integrase catalytic domain-containing protein n=1 Tax=Trichogramma kaykai TaxID=54128 RepID=A0ABD2W558_9HYME